MASRPFALVDSHARRYAAALCVPYSRRIPASKFVQANLFFRYEGRTSVSHQPRTYRVQRNISSLWPFRLILFPFPVAPRRSFIDGCFRPSCCNGNFFVSFSQLIFVRFSPQGGDGQSPQRLLMAPQPSSRPLPLERQVALHGRGQCLGIRTHMRTPVHRV